MGFIALIGLVGLIGTMRLVGLVGPLRSRLWVYGACRAL